MRPRLSSVLTMVVLLAAAGLLAPPPAPAVAPAAPLPAGYLEPRLVPINRVAGRIVDFSPGRILYQHETADGPRLTVKSRRTGELTPVPAGPYEHIGYGRLVPGGVVLVGIREPDPVYRVTVWLGGPTVENVGIVTTPAAVSVRDQYLFWTVEGSLRRRDLSTGRTVLVATTAQDIRAEPGPGGDAVFWAVDPLSQLSSIYRYHDGVSSLVPTATASGRRPILDGTAVVYCGGALAWSTCELWRYDGRQTRLAWPADRVIPQPGSGYEAVGGWTAFLREQANERWAQLWLRAPDGLVGQVSAATRVTGPPHLVALNAGQVLYQEGSALFLGRLRQPPVLLAADVGEWDSRRIPFPHNLARYFDSHWLLAAGDTLYLRASRPPTTLTGAGTARPELGGARSTVRVR